MQGVFYKMFSRIFLRKSFPPVYLNLNNIFLAEYSKKCCKFPLIRNTTFPIFNSPNFKSLQRCYAEQVNIEQMIVDYDHVKNATSNKDILIIDVREPEEIKEHGKIPSSVNIPLGNVSTVLSTMSDMEFENMYNRKKPNEDTEIIFYCMIGKRSGMAQQNAVNLGFKNVKNYLGSWTEWATKTR